MNDIKKVYQAPKIEIEIYELNMDIASNCKTVVNAGPGLEGKYDTCSDYVGIVDTIDVPGDDVGRLPGAYNVNFYEESNCDCYYSSSGSQVWTS